MNSVIISGRLGRDPEERRTGSGKQVVQFSIALDNWKDDAPTEWVRVQCWEKTAEFVMKYLVKGRKVLVDGRIQVRQWDDKDMGKKREQVEVVANRVEFMDSQPKGDQPSAPSQPSAPRAPAKPAAPAAADGAGDPGAAYFDDDVPF